MRFRFLQTGRAWDEKQRAAVLDRIDAWWSSFADARADIESLLRGEKQWDLPGWVNKHLLAIDERLRWEFGPRQLAITPEADRELHPMIETILDRSPGFDGWEFLNSRPRESVDHAVAMLDARGLQGIENTRVVATATDENLVDLTFFSKRYDGPDDQNARNSAFVASESILGEETLSIWIGNLRVQRGSGRRERAVRMSELQNAVDVAIRSVKGDLPAQPLWKIAETARYSLWELKPEEREDYPHQFDLLVGKSCHAAMWVAARSNVAFDSRRYSRFGELFAYVKTDSPGSLSSEQLQNKDEMEDALADALARRELGAVIGGGYGQRYSYIDLALSKPDEAIETIIEVLREKNAVRESWIQFFDARYANEWVGIWEESPPPPGIDP